MQLAEMISSLIDYDSGDVHHMVICIWKLFATYLMHCVEEFTNII